MYNSKTLEIGKKYFIISNISNIAYPDMEYRGNVENYFEFHDGVNKLTLTISNIDNQSYSIIDNWTLIKNKGFI